MKTQQNAKQAGKQVMHVRTQLQAGRRCHPWDTSCVSKQGHYNSCGNEIPGAGAACFAANLAQGVPFDDAICNAC